MSTCLFHWSDNDGKPGSNHVCGKPHEHDDEHTCVSCGVTYELPLAQAVRVVADSSTIEPALIDAIDALFNLPEQPKPGDVADRVARFLDLIGTGAAKALADKIRDARNDGDRLMSLLPELEALQLEGTAVS